MSLRTSTHGVAIGALVLLIIWSVAPARVLEAVEDTVIVNVSVTDQTDPSAPTALTATAVSSSQINLSWTASSDDIGVSTYKIYRDMVHIASSTSTTYSDTGLTSSTSYDYTVTAVDAAGNESLHSATSSATTLAPGASSSASSASSSSGGGGGGPPGNIPQLDLINIEITPTLNSATVTWETTVPANSVISWGTTPDFEMGSEVEIGLRKNHSSVIPGLTENTLYYFRIVVTDAHNDQEGFTGTFQTLSSTPVPPDGEGPIPALPNFSATPRDNGVDLNWQYPSDPRVTEVRIVRSTTFFPTNPNEGVVIYEGPGTSARDTNVTPGTRYYYTAFPKAGNAFGTPSVDDAYLPKEGEPTTEPTDPFEQFPDALTTDPKIQGLTIFDFDFYQNGQLLPKVGNRVFIDGTQNLTIAIDYDKLPEILKTIGITLIHPEDEESTFSFILRVNENKTRYEATIAPLGLTGMYPMSIRVLDYENRGMKRLRGAIYVAAASSQQEPEAQSFLGSTELQNMLLIILNVLLILLFFKRRRRKEEEPTS